MLFLFDIIFLIKHNKFIYITNFNFTAIFKQFALKKNYICGLVKITIKTLT
jgi:hypothetical protein